MPTVLLVDDNDDSRDALSRWMSRRGYEVLPAADGADAVQQAATRRFDLILMDMTLPILDGWEATRAIRADALNSETPIIALTAHALAGDRERTRAAGCDDYHAKPVELTKLLSQIELLIQSSPNR